MNQTEGTAMRTKRAPPYAYLVGRCKEEIRLFRYELPKLSPAEETKIIKETFKRYTNNGFLL